MGRKADELMWFCPCLVIGLLRLVYSDASYLLTCSRIVAFVCFKVSTTRHIAFVSIEQVLASLTTHISLSMRLLTRDAIYRLDTSRCLSWKVSDLF